MDRERSAKLIRWAPATLAVVLGAALLVWLAWGPDTRLGLRVPGADSVPGGEGGSSSNAVLAGKLVRSGGTAADLPGEWLGFRGGNRDGISTGKTSLARSWTGGSPRELWSVDVGEGYAGAAVWAGRVYLMDYDRDQKQDALRCLSLGDGKEVWRYSYPVRVKRNHGMSRTVPAVNGKLVVAMGPKCHVVCLDASSGELKWGIDLVRQFGTTIPPWYAGQCPLIDEGKVILAPGGPEALLVAVEGETGRVLWQTPNPDGWKMTHSSVMPMDFDGRRFYVYCANLGVVGVSATNGAIAWQTKDWKISIATVPSPVVLPEGRLFLSGGYNAGSLMLQLGKNGGGLTAKTLFKLDADTFGATQHTPILFGDHIYGIRPDGRLVCLTTEGKVAWASEPTRNFGLGPFLIAQGLIYALSESGELCLVEANPSQCTVLAAAHVLHGREAWGPMSLAGGRLLARDLTRLVCLEVGSP